MDNENRTWVYTRLNPDGLMNHAFLRGVDKFINFAIAQPNFKNGVEIRCPCTKCKNKTFLHPNKVRYHLYKRGFRSNYTRWTYQGESFETIPSMETVPVTAHDARSEPDSPLRQLIYDAAGPEIAAQLMEEEEPNPQSQRFFDMLHELDEELWPGCENHSVFSMTSRLLSIKSENHMSESCFDSLLQLFNEALPEDNKLVGSFYETKKLIKKLGLPVEKIDCCQNGCMLYWKDDVELEECKFCNAPRFKTSETSSRKSNKIPVKRMYYFPISPRLTRLYASKKTAAEMTWHHDHVCDDDTMCHPCDSEAWRAFDIVNSEFASEPRNVRLGLCTDGFSPFGQSGQQYSCWPVILTPYNLPPWMCMKEPYMFLTVLVPGPTNPKHKIDVFLQPLIDELNLLWEQGVPAYDVSSKTNFTLRVGLLWTISDFPAYSMLFGWSTAGKLACPHCMGDTQSFYLKNGRKMCWFDNHRRFLPMNHQYRKNKKKFIDGRVEKLPPPIHKTGLEIFAEIESLGLKKVTELGAEEWNANVSKENCGWKKKSIFWDLPYWKTNLVRHNLDVMHIEKNVFDNVFNTVMNIEGKTKDNVKAREDILLLCRRPELAKDLEARKYPKACYTLDQRQKKILCDWVKKLKFPDGYVSNLGRCVDGKNHRLFGMKSHDCHVFMQRLLPIAFRELLPKAVWEAITELSMFFKNLSGSVLKIDEMRQLEKDIPIILCKLETIFPPGFFDSMEHLTVHLPFEARIAGPVQFRWMYPFERYLGHLKRNVRNKARVEGSICNAYLVEEASFFCSHYFEPHVYTRVHKVPRNDDGGPSDDRRKSEISIFQTNGRLFGRSRTRWLPDKEYNAIHTYVLLNCPEIDPFVEILRQELSGRHPNATIHEIESMIDEKFSQWFYQYGEMNKIDNPWVDHLRQGPGRGVILYPMYFVNGYKFHTESRAELQVTSNNSVCVVGEGFEYYGIIEEILQVTYAGPEPQKVVMFKCQWYDPTPNVGTKVHPLYKIVEVNTKRYFRKYEPFILASQGIQVYFAPYPSTKRDKIDWRVACTVKARGVVAGPENKEAHVDDAFQEEDLLPTNFVSETSDVCNLDDPVVGLIHLPEDEFEDNEEGARMNIDEESCQGQNE